MHIVTEEARNLSNGRSEKKKKKGENKKTRTKDDAQKLKAGGKALNGDKREKITLGRN
jgi:hypothetical protein